MLDELLHPVHQDHTPWLDRTGPDWLGCFPGLGTVRVGPDGATAVEVADGPAPDRERALRHGWAEPLALARLGHHLARGCTLAGGGRAVLVTGTPDEVGQVALGLAGDGWALLADGLCPLTERDGGWLALPRSAPLLVRRRVARRAWTEGVPVRGGSDALAVGTATAPSGGDAPEGPDSDQAGPDRPGPDGRGPVPLAAVLHVHRCTGPEPVALHQVTGAERLRTASTLLVGGVLGQPAGDPGALLRRHLSLAAVPAARLGTDPREAASAMALVQAWPALRGPDAGLVHR